MFHVLLALPDREKHGYAIREGGAKGSETAFILPIADAVGDDDDRHLVLRRRAQPVVALVVPAPWMGRALIRAAVRRQTDAGAWGRRALLRLRGSHVA